MLVAAATARRAGIRGPDDGNHARVEQYVTRQRAHPQSFFASRRENFANARPAFNRTNAFAFGQHFALENARGDTRVTFRIHRSSTPDAIVFALSGDIDREHAARLQQFLTSDTGRRRHPRSPERHTGRPGGGPVSGGRGGHRDSTRQLPGVRAHLDRGRERQPAATDSGAGQSGATTVIRRGDGRHLHFVADIPHCQRPAARLSLERTTTPEIEATHDDPVTRRHGSRSAKV